MYNNAKAPFDRCKKYLHFFVIQQHAIDFLNSLISSFLRFKMDVTNPFDTSFSSKAILQERMFPKALKVSYKALLSIFLSKFLIKIFPTPDLRKEGSRWHHIIRHGRPLIGSKFIVSKALSAENIELISFNFTVLAVI